MDPVSVAAIAGLVYAGKRLSDPAPPQQPMPFFGNNINTPTNNNEAPLYDSLTGPYVVPPQTQRQKEAVPSFGVVAPNAGRNPYGQPVYNLYDRQDVSGKMNSVQPNEKQYVGPGLGVGGSVPAFGGYQQLYRVMPNNVNGYKLTTLPGRTGPASAIVKNQAKIGELTQERPEKVAAIWERRPPVKGRAEGQGGALTGMAGRQNFERTKRQTNRSTTTMRDDGLEFGAASRFISAPTVDDNPTRNKGDWNEQRVNDVAAPGISNFKGGYQIDPALTTGIRAAVNRGNKGRTGNAGRMNVRADPVNQIGSITAVRDSATTCLLGTPGPTAAVNQTYVKDKYYQFNPYKGQTNFHTNRLGLAKTQLSKNPLNQNFS